MLSVPTHSLLTGFCGEGPSPHRDRSAGLSMNPSLCILVFDGEQLKESYAFISVLHIKHEKTDMNSSVMGEEFGSLPLTKDTVPTTKVHEKDPSTVPAFSHHDPLKSVWPSHLFSIGLSGEFINKR